MKNKIKIICLALAMALAPITGNVMADKHDKVGPYAGLGFGHTRIDGGGTLKPKDWAPSIFGGYIPHRNFGVEAGLAWAGLDTGGDVEISANTFYIAGIGRYYVSDDFAVYAKGGAHRWQYEAKDTDASIDFDGIHGLFGLGVQLDASENTSLRLEWSRYIIDETKGNLEVDGQFDIIGVQMLYRL